jgi:hypothetical protein
LAKFYHFGLDKGNFLFILDFTFSEFSLKEIIHYNWFFARGIDGGDEGISGVRKNPFTT